MSCLQTNTSLHANSNFDEHRWVIQIRRVLDEELEDDGEVTVSIFSVPKSLLHGHPDSYTPQQVALGPYHHCRLELNEMERYKLSAAKRAQSQLQGSKFQDLVDQLIRLEPRIRACYHKFLDLNGETLAWMMAIDSSFMLEFLQIYAIRECKMLSRIPSRMSHLVDYAGRRSAHNAILRDMVMLENQIPLFVLRKILESQYSSLAEADDMLLSMLKGFCKELSLFKMIENLPMINVSESAHLLDFLYNSVVPTSETPEAEEHSDDIQGEENSSGNPCNVKQSIENITKGSVNFIKKMLLSRPLKVIVKIPWTFISNLPIISIFKQPVEHILFTQDNEEIKTDNQDMNKPPLVEEITIPSVTELSKSGVRFLPTNGNISTISFDYKNVTFYLPCISLDVNTEVTLRNLVAYEAANASGPLVFTRYTELMNGIIDTEDDVKLLRERNIVFNHLKSDKEAADMWNGMSKSIRLTKVPFLDQVIEDVNGYYNGRWTVKIGKVYQEYVLSSRHMLAMLCVLLLLLMMSLQSFCSLYNCSSRTKTT